MDGKLNLYAGGTLDRAAELRKDGSWLTTRLTAPDTRLVPMWRSATWVAGPDDAPRAAFLPGAEAAWLDTVPAAERALLGLDGDVAYVAVDLSDLDRPDDHPALRDRGGRFIELPQVAALLPPDEASLCAYARGLLWWHRRHRFCGVCGHATVSEESGHVRRCRNPDCATPHFPRTDPAVIMLVHDGDRVLLARQPRFAPGLYSVLAGFVEPGESLEDAVAREVFEETGVRVGRVRYHSSQPWPFPASIMLGFTAQAATTAITLPPDEIEEAGWYDRDWLRQAGDTEAFRLPRIDSIARRMVVDWLDGRVE